MKISDITAMVITAMLAIFSIIFSAAKVAKPSFASRPSFSQKPINKFLITNNFSLSKNASEIKRFMEINISCLSVYLLMLCIRRRSG